MQQQRQCKVFVTTFLIILLKVSAVLTPNLILTWHKQVSQPHHDPSFILVDAHYCTNNDITQLDFIICLTGCLAVVWDLWSTIWNQIHKWGCILYHVDNIVTMQLIWTEDRFYSMYNVSRYIHYQYILMQAKLSDSLKWQYQESLMKDFFFQFSKKRFMAVWHTKPS